MTEEIRQIAGRYHLIELIGSGAMGMVWRARDTQLDRDVAIKELLLPYGQGEEKATEAKNRSMREARIAARLQHPHAITVFSVVEEEDRPWLIMEYLPSKSLSAVLKDGPLPVDEAIRIACQLCSALAAAHRAGVVHRDVKPGNVLLGEDGTVKVTDFGISRAIGDVTLTATGEISGTPAFIAPEVARGEDAGYASDVFSLGATLYTAVEGVTPFGTADNAIALLYRASSGEITPPKQAGRLTPLLNRLLEVKPEDRPTMVQAEHELLALAAAPLAAAAPGPAATARQEIPIPPAPPMPAPVDQRKRRMILVSAGAVLLVLIVIGVILVAFRPAPPTGTASGTGASQQQSPPPTPLSNAVQPPPVDASSSAPPPSTSTPASTPSSPAAPAAQSAAQAISSYYGSLLSDLDGSFARLTDNFKTTHKQTITTYKNYWSGFKSVSAGAVTARDANTVVAEITYVRQSGETVHERDTFTLVQQNGTWLIDTQRVG